MAKFYSDNHNYLLSIEIQKEVLIIYEKLLQKKYKKFALIYYKSLNALAEGYLKTEQVKLAKEYYISLEFGVESTIIPFGASIWAAFLRVSLGLGACSIRSNIVMTLNNSFVKFYQVQVHISVVYLN